MIIDDSLSGIHFFFVDIGAEISVIPPGKGDRKVDPNLTLMAANSSCIRTIPSRRI